MLRRCALLVAGLVWLGPTAAARQPPQAAAPSLSFAREPVVIPTIEGVVTQYQNIREPLDRTDYASSKALELRIIPVSVDRALANVHWQRFKKDGSLFGK